MSFHIVFVLIALLSLGFIGCDDAIPAEAENPAYMTSLVADCEGCDQDADTTLIAFCDLEQIISLPTEQRWLGTPDSITFGNATRFSKEVARSGKFSCMIKEGMMFGISFRMSDVEAGDHYRATIWRKGEHGNFVSSADTKRLFFQTSSEVVQIDEDGWEQLVMNITVPPHIDGQDLVIYVLNTHADTAYFDDFKIVKLSERLYPFQHNDDVIHLNIDEAGWQHLAEKREAAFRRGLLFSKKEDWVDANVQTKAGSAAAKVRLKGDWLDHLQGDKWSFRIKPESGSPFGAISMHTPHARHFMDEWLYHKLLQREGVLTPRYDFKFVEVNGRSLGIYAVEDHFDQALIKSFGLPDGPIVKFNEDAFWEMAEFVLDSSKSLLRYVPDLQTSVVTPFDKHRLDEPEFRAQFEEAQLCMHALRYGTRPISEVADAESMAKLYAVCEVARAWHSIRWHNIRFYYHPIEKKLYPVAFDGYSDVGPYEWQLKPFMGYWTEKHKDVYMLQEMFLHSPFNDPIFSEYYFENVRRMSSIDYVKTAFIALEEEMMQCSEMLQLEFPTSEYGGKYFVQGAEHMRGFTAIYDSVLETKNWPVFNYIPWELVGDSILRPEPFLKQDLLVYQQEIGEQTTLRLLCFRAGTIEIVGSSKSKKSEKLPISKQAVILPRFHNELELVTTDVQVPNDAKYIWYKVPEAEGVFRAKIIRWKSPY